MEIAHADLAEVARVVLVKIGAVVVLTTGHTAAAGVLAVLADAAVAGGDVAATGEGEEGRISLGFGFCGIEIVLSWKNRR